MGRPSGKAVIVLGAIVLALLEPALRRLCDLVDGLAARMGFSLGLSYGAFVSKCAHFAEYFLLGSECVAIAVVLADKVAINHSTVIEEFGYNYYLPNPKAVRGMKAIAIACWRV